MSAAVAMLRWPNCGETTRWGTPRWRVRLVQVRRSRRVRNIRHAFASLFLSRWFLGTYGRKATAFRGPLLETRWFSEETLAEFRWLFTPKGMEGEWPDRGHPVEHRAGRRGTPGGPADYLSFPPGGEGRRGRSIWQAGEVADSRGGRACLRRLSSGMASGGVAPARGREGSAGQPSPR